MCGIFALYKTSPEALPVDAEELKGMARALVPSQTEGGSYALWEAFLGLGQTDCAGQRMEPLFTRSGTIALVAHAKLTDRSSWLRRLSERGVPFGAQSDNEILLYAYEQFGVECFTQFTGRFAFILWDAEQRLLIAARDSLGLSTLYFTEQQGRTYFASEVHAFFSKNNLEKRLNPRYFSDTLLGVSHPHDTPFGSIREIPAGSYLQIDKAGKQSLHFFENHKEFAGAPEAKVFEPATESWTPESVAKDLHSYLWNLGTPVDKVSALGRLKFRPAPKALDALDERLLVWPRYGLPKNLLPHLLHKGLRNVLPAKIEVFIHNPIDAHVETMSWREIARSPTGRRLFRSYMSLEELDDTQLFAPLTTKCVIALWHCLPLKSPLGKSIDSLIGLILTCQMLNRLFLKYRFTPDALHYWQQVTPERHLPMRSELLEVEHPPIRNWSIPEFLESRRTSDWHRFMLRHTHTGNFILHFVSMLFFFGSPIVAYATENPLWLLLFFSSGLVGTAGHFLFKDGGVSVREATIKIMVPMFVLRMFYTLLKGRYFEELRQAQDARDAVVSSRRSA